MLSTSETAKRLNYLSAAKRALIEKRLKGELSDAREAPVIGKRRQKAGPLSFGQQRLWFIDQLEAGTAFYNMPASVRLTGEVNLAALEAAFNEIVRRHEILRTVFGEIDRHPQQFIQPSSPTLLALIDLSGLTAAQREKELLLLAAEEARHLFDLSRGPLFRVTLLRLSANDHVILLTMHHIVSDGWSMSVLVREVAALYETFSQGKSSALAELPIQYADYAAWHREYLQGEILERQLEYWRRQLGEELPVLELSTLYPRPPLQTYSGGHLSFSVPPDVSSGLKALSQQREVTLFITLLAAFQVLLSRHTSQSDIVVGTDVANRTQRELEDLIGFFTNQLVMRTDLSGDPSFVELLKRVREVSLGAYAHQDVPFERLVEELHPDRTLSHTPLFQVKFILQNTPAENIEVGGLSLTAIPSDSGAARFDITLALTEVEEVLLGSIQYSTDLFEEATIRRMAGHFQDLLRSIVADPTVPLSQLEMLSQAERQQLLVEWNGTKREYPRAQCVHELFEAWVERTPEAIAVICGSEQLSYQELNQRANQLGHYLQSLGVGPEVLVGICLERSVEMLVSVLAILKAGGAYVPLDPEYPLERLSFMLEDANLGLLLTQEQLIEQLPTHWGQTICIDREWERILEESGENVLADSRAENLAYVIYTSGSTGDPKGVLIQHGGICNLVTAQTEFFGVGPSSRLLQFASLSFDAAVFETFTALCSGATLCVSTAEAVLGGSALIKLLQEQRVSRATLPPSVLSVLPADEVSGLETVISVGEACSASLVERWTSGGRRFLNGYGPTETTIAATVGQCHYDGRRPTIGKPLANMEVYILNEQQQLMPVGGAGEIYVGGVGLARGYLNLPELTAARFIPHPYAGEAGARLYRTGDRGRYLANGEIEYLGRVDEQVKVRGYRIELGEVEAALRAHPLVQEAVVLCREDLPGEKRLVAYLVTAAEAGWNLSQLRGFLKERIPQYMIPASFVPLDQLPLTPHGKVNRRALPAPGQMSLHTESASPHTQVEDLLCGLWAELLGVSDPGIHDDFFELGGHSLLATQLISRVREIFQVEVALRVLFEQPTIAGLAASIESALHEDHGTASPPVRKVSREEKLPLSFAQQRLWFLDQLEPANVAFNMATAVRLSGRLDIEVLERTLSEIIRRHETLRTHFAVIDGKPVQVIAEAQPVRLPLANLCELEEAERQKQAERLVREEAERPFDLTTGPLLRMRLIRLEADEHIISLTMHHIISDGWSMELLIKEVAELSEAFTNGKPSRLPELAVQYADYAAWQREWLRDELLVEQLNYWRRQLGGDLPVLDLPLDRPRPALQSYRGAKYSMRMRSSLVMSLKELSRRSECTFYMTLLAAFAVLLSRHTSQTDIVIGTDIANRRHREVEEMIGFFTNQLVMRTDLSGDPTFLEVIKRVREVCLEAYAHQDLPFEKLVEELRPERTLSHAPLFQVKMVLQTPRTQELRFSELTLTPMQVVRETAEFDLTLSLMDSGGELFATFEYSRDLFEEETIRGLGERFERLLEGIVVDAGERISRLPLLLEREREQLMEWKGRRRDYGGEECVNEMFEGWVERNPEAIAMVCGAEQVSYGELNRRANQLGHYLRKQGVGVEVLVGLCLGRSIELVVSILAVFKAGGAYVALDPAYPLERLSMMLEDANLGLLLTEEKIIEELPAHWGQTICLERAAGEIAGESGENLGEVGRWENLAYVVYTSGSTGMPKGVLIQHGGVSNLVRAQAEFFAVGPGSRLLQFASYSFDAAVFETFTALCSGARLVMSSGEAQLGGAALMRMMQEQGVNKATLPPTVLAQLPEAVDGELETVISVGEACPGRLVERWRRDGRRFLNGYGPTETTIAATVGECAEGGGSPTIGRPITNQEVYILDEQKQLKPVGVVGEIYVGGAGLGRGYLNRPELTAERFIPHPYSEVGGARLYRTGDLGRYLRSGEIEYVGRVDQQVKVRGYRIELGEIEGALQDHPLVAETVVVCREDQPGEKRLVAYLVTAEAVQLKPSELRGFLKERLPDYMMPASFVFLGKLPLTPQGKIDRRCLPAPESLALAPAIAFVGPQTGLEQILVAIWQDVLNTQQVGIHDNFFDLGGHSLLIAQLHALLQDALQIKFPMVHLFAYPTVNSLAEFLGGMVDQQPTETILDTRGETRRDLMQQQALLRESRRSAASVGADND